MASYFCVVEGSRDMGFPQECLVPVQKKEENKTGLEEKEQSVIGLITLSKMKSV